MSNRKCQVMLFSEYDKGLVIIQATWPTPLQPKGELERFKFMI